MKKTILLAILLTSSLPAVAGEKVINMYKSENCSCCTLWGQAMEKEGFKVQTHVMNEQDLSALKKRYSVPADVRSCHTATAGNMVIEGHVPATAIRKALQPDAGIYGLATPGMPAGSPGMEMGNKKESYNVMAFTQDGDKSVFQRID